MNIMGGACYTVGGSNRSRDEASPDPPLTTRSVRVFTARRIVMQYELGVASGGDVSPKASNCPSLDLNGRTIKISLISSTHWRSQDL